MHVPFGAQPLWVFVSIALFSLKNRKQKLENFYEFVHFEASSFVVHFIRMGSICARFLFQTNRLVKRNRLICKQWRSIRMQLFSQRKKRWKSVTIRAWEIEFKSEMKNGMFCHAWRSIHLSRWIFQISHIRHSNGSKNSKYLIFIVRCLSKFIPNHISLPRDPRDGRWIN